MPDESVTHWLGRLKAGDNAAAGPLWRRYFPRLVTLARARLANFPRRAADEEDVALSAFDSFCRDVAAGRLPRPSSRDEPLMTHFICVTCGTQFAATPVEPDGCPICLDERQYVGPAGQTWPTLDECRKTHRNVFAEEEAGLHSILPQPKAGIGPRPFVVRAKEGDVLWDCVPPHR